MVDNGSEAVVCGEFEPGFERVRDAFEANFRTRGEMGAAVCVYSNGRKVVDLWGGLADPESQTPWHRDTIVGMMSVGKGMAALCVLMLADRGQLDLDEAVASYWPEFAQAGKAEITVRTLLQSKAALLFADAAPDGSGFDWDTMIRSFESQAPEWEPGTKGAYHTMSAGFLLGELVRRVDGRPLETFFDDEVAGPLGVDYRFGLRRADFPRTAKISAPLDQTLLDQMATPGTPLHRAWRIRPRPADLRANPSNDPDYLMARFPSANGQGNARAVARVYAALAESGELDGVRLISRELIDQARTPSWEDICPMTGMYTRYGAGFVLPDETTVPWPGRRAFGHPGLGGALGIADPEARLAFAYSPNHLDNGAGLGERCTALIDALWSDRAQ
ncbi:serine hydrolase domain-containing protein [Streptomyces subrutilus]|uniref:serine hydrolase domain-containing protein n=1 Tax=Streptomyces subrutilus TaxID=36818 RepID=UPI0033F0B83B